MKPTNVVVVFTCADTGKAYAIDLEKTQIGSPLILGMLSVEGPLHAVEVEPFVLRSKGMSEERAAQLLEEQEAAAKAQRIVDKQNRLHLGAREGFQSMADALIGRQVSIPVKRVDKDRATFKHSGTHKGGTMRVPALPENLPREVAQSDGREIDRIGVEAEEQKHRERLAKALRSPPQNLPRCEHLTEFAGQCVECGMSVDEIRNGPKIYRKD